MNCQFIEKVVFGEVVWMDGWVDGWMGGWTDGWKSIFEVQI